MSCCHRCIAPQDDRGNNSRIPEGPQTQTVKAVLRVAKEIIALTGVSEAEAFDPARMDLEANTGLLLAPLWQVLHHGGDAGSDQRARQLGQPHVEAQLDAEQLAERLGISRETLRQLRLQGVLQPGKHFRRWGCTQGKGPLPWHLENVEATITGWSRRNLRQ